MRAVRAEIMILPLENLRLQTVQGCREWHLHTTGLGILPIGSVGIVIGAGLAILTALLESIVDLTL